MPDIMMRKLLVEEPSFELSYLLEEKNRNEPSTLYIQGLFLMSEQKNKNKRIYSLDEMVTDVARYDKEMIREKRSIGELNHPESVEVNPERASHMITELKQDGNSFIGKAKILSTPIGTLTRALIMDGVKLGVSSRALGKVTPQNDSFAVSGFHLICCDIVHDPSVASAFVNGILESKSWIIESNGNISEVLYDTFETKLNNLPKNSTAKEVYLKDACLQFINTLKNM